ncbi:hypothetical protein [Halarcobacter sp.]|uniref:hypothetical protein n=1 Tax=Halarcobacter sp. TaxID=2321133 RepID=UPI0029F49614|nr:hypothetical protein [Halarcobacter sp.]
MINYRKFTYRFIGILVLLILFHFTVWNIYTKYVFPENYNVGDLGRMSYLKDSLFPRVSEVTLPKKHMESHEWDWKDTDLITLGDSFSNGGGAGKNTYYQDYIASYNDFRVLNLKQLTKNDNYLNSIIALYNNGFFDKIKVDYVLIESVEREAIRRFTMKTDLTLSLSNEEIKNKLDNSKNQFQGGPLAKENINSFISNLNVNALKYNILYNFKDNAYSSNVYRLKLTKEFFSVKDSNILLAYKDDLKRLHMATKKNVELMNENINKVAKLLKTKNIKLYFMPAVDKYNLYSKYIIDNKYPKSTFFEYLRDLPKEYIFIDTKKILLEELEKGKKDIFYSDDTHWSFNASRTIFEKVKFD